MHRLRILQTFLNRENYSLHNIHLLTFLNDKNDFHIIDWPVDSDSNGGKKGKFPMSRVKGRYVTIIVYPSGSINISLKCSKSPYDFTTIEGPTSFHSDCGQIQNIINAVTSNSDALKDEPPDWWMTECDIAVDIKVPELEKAINESNESDTGKIHWNFGGSIQVKYLSHLYQFYNRNTIDGKVLRYEERLHFSPSKRLRLREVEKKLLNNQIANFLNSMRIRDLEEKE